MKRARILVVDDEAAILDAVGKLLIQDGFEVEVTSSPTLAIETCAQNPPTFVITDFLMSEMSGEELAVQLHLELGWRTPRIICVTAWLMELRADQTRVFDRVIEKPFAYCDLVRVLDELEREPRQIAIRRSDRPRPEDAAP